MKPAEARRNDAIGPAATIPYSRCRSQARVVVDPKKNHRHSRRPWRSPEWQRAERIEYESYGISFVIRNDVDTFLIQSVCCTYAIPPSYNPSSTCEVSRDHLRSGSFTFLPPLPQRHRRPQKKTTLSADSSSSSWSTFLILGHYLHALKDVVVPIAERQANPGSPVAKNSRPRLCFVKTRRLYRDDGTAKMGQPVCNVLDLSEAFDVHGF